MRDALVHGVVFRQQDPQRWSGAVSSPRAPLPRAGRREVSSAASTASRSAACRTGFTRYAAMPTSLQRCASPNWSDEVSIITVGGAIGLIAQLFRGRKAVHPRHVDVEEHEIERLTAPLRVEDRIDRGRDRSRRAVGTICHFSRIF